MIPNLSSLRSNATDATDATGVEDVGAHLVDAYEPPFGDLRNDNSNKILYPSYANSKDDIKFGDALWECESYANKAGPYQAFPAAGGNGFPYRFQAKAFATMDEVEVPGSNFRYQLVEPFNLPGGVYFYGDFDIVAPVLAKVSWVATPGYVHMFRNNLTLPALDTMPDLFPPVEARNVPQRDLKIAWQIVMTIDLIEADKLVRLCGTLLYSDWHLPNQDKNNSDTAALKLLASCPYYNIGRELSGAPGSRAYELAQSRFKSEQESQQSSVTMS